MRDVDPRRPTAFTMFALSDKQALEIEEARAQLRIEDDRLDSLIKVWLQGLTGHLEKTTGRALIYQRCLSLYSQFSEEMFLPIAPVVVVESITYKDNQGQRQAFDHTQFDIVQNSTRARLVLREDAVLPETIHKDQEIEVLYKCGYGSDSSQIPADLRLYLMMRLVEQFDSASNGSAPAQTSFADYLLEPYRVFQAG